MRRDQWRTSLFCNIASISEKKLLAEWLQRLHDTECNALDTVAGATEERIEREVIK